MTVVVGYLDKKEHKLYMGADRCVSYADRKLTLNHPKFAMFEIDGIHGELLLGWAGMYKNIQLLQHTFQPPPHNTSNSVEKYLAVDFIDALQKCLFERVVPTPNDEGVLSGYMGLLILYSGRIFTIDGDFCLVESDMHYNAIGSGEHFSLGALHALSLVDVDDELTAEQQVLVALHSAEKYSNSVEEPFDIESIDIPEYCRWYLAEDEDEAVAEQVEVLKSSPPPPAEKKKTSTNNKKVDKS